MRTQVDDIALARQWAELYRARGFNVLPSRTDAKRPMVRFAQWWETPTPPDLLDRHPTTNLQIMAGRRWRLLVIDLDGPAAREWWHGLGHPIPRTWTTHSGGDGIHLWFRLPGRLETPLPKAFLWRGPGEHEAVERICDRGLVMAPPSIHPGTGRRYRFLDRQHSPLSLPLPAPCPAWVLALEPLLPERPAFVPPARPAAPIRPPATGRYDAREVLDAIPDKVGLAAQWGLRVASRRPNAAGWCPCHCVGREDRNPSASISATTGRYWEPGQHPISLFELGVQLGRYGDWRDAVADLGSRFRVRNVVA